MRHDGQEVVADRGVSAAGGCLRPGGGGMGGVRRGGAGRGLSSRVDLVAWSVSVVAVVAGVMVLPGCRGDRTDKPPRQLLPDMEDSPKWKPQSKSEFFADGRTMRPPVPGTVAFGRVDFDPEAYRASGWARLWLDQRADLLKADDAFYRGVDADGEFLDRAPVAITRELLARGRERFNIYCSACHGYGGDGQGLVGQRWAIPVANFHDPKYQDVQQRTGKDGYLFHVIRNGVGEPGALTMPSYAHAISERDAWAIVAYVRALQASRRMDLEALPAEVRSRLTSLRPTDQRAGGVGGAP